MSSETPIERAVGHTHDHIIHIPTLHRPREQKLTFSHAELFALCQLYRILKEQEGQIERYPTRKMIDSFSAELTDTTVDHKKYPHYFSFIDQLTEVLHAICICDEMQHYSNLVNHIALRSFNRRDDNYIIQKNIINGLCCIPLCVIYAHIPVLGAMLLFQEKEIHYYIHFIAIIAIALPFAFAAPYIQTRTDRFYRKKFNHLRQSHQIAIEQILQNATQFDNR